MDHMQDQTKTATMLAAAAVEQAVRVIIHQVEVDTQDMEVSLLQIQLVEAAIIMALEALEDHTLQIGV